MKFRRSKNSQRFQESYGVLDIKEQPKIQVPNKKVQVLALNGDVTHSIKSACIGQKILSFEKPWKGG